MAGTKKPIEPIFKTGDTITDADGDMSAKIIKVTKTDYKLDNGGSLPIGLQEELELVSGPTQVEQITNETIEKNKKEEKEKEMNNTLLKTAGNTLLSNNKTAFVGASQMQLGKIVTNRAVAALAGKMPLGTGKYLETPFGKVVAANIAALMIKHYRPDDRKLNFVVDGMMQSAAYESIDAFDIDGMIAGLLQDVNVDNIIAKSEEEEALAELNSTTKE